MVKKLYSTEALLRVFFNPEDRSYALKAPAQEASSGYVVELETSPPPEGCLLACVMHSHPHQAFQSSTDQSNEARLDGMHITVGNLEEPIAAHAGSRGEMLYLLFGYGHVFAACPDKQNHGDRWDPQ